MAASYLVQAPDHVQDDDVHLHLKEILVTFDDGRRPNSELTIKFEEKTGFKMASKAFKKADDIRWDIDIYLKSFSELVVTIRKAPFNNPIAKFELQCDPTELGEQRAIHRIDVRNGAFMQVVFGTSKPSVEVVGALGSQACAALASKVSMLSKMENLLDFLDVILIGGGAGEFNTVTKSVLSIVSKAMEKFREIPTCHKHFVDIMNDLVSLLPVMRLALRRIQDSECLELVQNFVAFIYETSRGLIEYATQSSTDFLLRNWFKSRKDEAMKLKDRTTQLKLNIGIGVGLDTLNSVSDIRKRQLRTEEASALRRIKPPKFSFFDPERCCMPGTRVTVLETVTSYALALNHPARFYWLYGIAGSGKSSVASSVALTLHNHDRLSGSFFCQRDVPELRNPINLLHTLAYAIAERHSSYRSVLVQVLKRDLLLEEKALALQFDTLLREPLLRVSQDLPDEQIIFIIDALDECDDSKSMSLFLSQMVVLAPRLRLIVTSRPLPDIELGLSRVEQYIDKCDLFIQNAQQDIESFIRGQFSIGGPLNDLQPYVDDAQVKSLAQKSSGLFIWIATVLSHINRLLFGKHAALLDILSSGNASGPEAQLDSLYRQVLHSVTGSSPANRDAVKIILAIIYVTSKNQSLPSGALHAFISRAGIRVSLHEFDSVLRQMGSVLTSDGQTGAIRVCHPSFLDFIASQSRSKDFWTRTEDVDAIMAKNCFEIMRTGLKFNICDLESSHIRNDEVHNLKERVTRNVPPELQYSCMYWLEHISQSNNLCKQEMQIAVQDFLGHNMSLYWLEVLSLVSELKSANTIITGLRLLYKDNSKLRDAAFDYYRFVNVLHEPMSTSTPHIYISALLWTPFSSIISTIPCAKLYVQPLILDGRHKDWSASLRDIECKADVLCLVYSPDGTRIVTGCGDDTICIWDALTGALILAPLKGHRGNVYSVVYSPNGTRFVSGSADETVCIWDAVNGTPTSSPLIGHTGPVWSVAYSPNGAYIVSGSGDRTIRIWNASNGALIGEPLMGHTAAVTSVMYSPDGTRIVSGSGDETIRIWDAVNGVLIGTPLVGHTDAVTCVAYSPGGNRVASGSGDDTIRIWNALTGAPTDECLKGHTSSIYAVAWSPDGKRIVSGSADDTIRVWDALNGTPIGGPLAAHTDEVRSVAYSPDGSCIASGSRDAIIRIWDASSRVHIGEPSVGHRSWINSVAFSREGAYIVSASRDKTIRIWDANSGLPYGVPLIGHTGAVDSVAYSPDGTRIASGSEDKTVRIWDALRAFPLGLPLLGHTDAVTSVAYSPNGSHVVSGSVDKTIRIWDALIGAPVGVPLVGHSSWVGCVVYSSDGTRIVSSSRDKTIRIWDALCGAAIHAFLVGHTDAISSVTCSPDGSRIVSSSRDETIRIWDASNGAPIGEPLAGHTGMITSVAYSCDGSRIVSSSWDNTIRIWDARNGAPMGVPLIGHTDTVTSVAISADGSRLASGSWDNSIRVWDAQPHSHAAVPRCVRGDGWLRTEDGGLLSWVPHEYRKGLGDMSLFSIPHDVDGYPIKGDWEGVRNVWDRLNREHRGDGEHAL